MVSGYTISWHATLRVETSSDAKFRNATLWDQFYQGYEKRDKKMKIKGIYQVASICGVADYAHSDAVSGNGLKMALLL
jgi:hypothetical protein